MREQILSACRLSGLLNHVGDKPWVLQCDQRHIKGAALGQYTFSDDVRPPEGKIGFLDEVEFPLVVAAHELGHAVFVAIRVELGSSNKVRYFQATRDLARSIQQTHSYRYLIAAQQLGLIHSVSDQGVQRIASTGNVGRANIAYFLMLEEMFAQAYLQFMWTELTQRTIPPGLRAVWQAFDSDYRAYASGSVSRTYLSLWYGDDFRKIQLEMQALLGILGWYNT